MQAIEQIKHVPFEGKLDASPSAFAHTHGVTAWCECCVAQQLLQCARSSLLKISIAWYAALLCCRKLPIGMMSLQQPRPIQAVNDTWFACLLFPVLAYLACCLSINRTQHMAKVQHKKSIFFEMPQVWLLKAPFPPIEACCDEGSN